MAPGACASSRPYRTRQWVEFSPNKNSQRAAWAFRSPSHAHSDPPTHQHTQHTTPTAPTNPPNHKDTDGHTQRQTETQTHRHTDTQTHAHRHTDTQAHRHTDTHTNTQTQSHPTRCQLPDGRWQIPQPHPATQPPSHTHTHTHIHPHTHTQSQEHTDKHTDTQPQSHPTRCHLPDAMCLVPDTNTHSLAKKQAMEIQQIKSTQPEGTNVKHRKQIGCMHSSQKQSCTRKALTLTVTVDRR
jgi:hypothetical protein